MRMRLNDTGSHKTSAGVDYLSALGSRNVLTNGGYLAVIVNKHATVFNIPIDNRLYITVYN